jgi:hypothetical protein
MRITIPAITRITRKIAQGIRIGERTHHQDQLITPTSFRVIKTMVSNPRNPIPPPELAVV